ncbi:MAG: protein phosphatase CheZ [Pseudomonadota bacterium]
MSKEPENVVGDLEDSVFGINDKLSLMEQFIARRFDEISMEINATSQQVDMAEEGIARRFSEILDIMSAISYQGEGETQVNTGVELEAVIGDTEEAANKILDAADRIAELVGEQKDWDNPDKREELLENIRSDVQNILLACTFQDLTGQRIRKTLENLQMIEERLSGTLNRLGINVETDKNKAVEEVSEGKMKAQSQDDIDALFAENRAE